MKTFIQQLESIRNKDARERAIANLNKTIEEGKLGAAVKELPMPSKLLALMGSFDFGTSPEGKDYWFKVVAHEHALDQMEQRMNEPASLN